HEPGGSSINSGEARDFLLGDCNTQLSCVSCHDPHTEDPKSALAALEGPKGDALCENCHQNLRAEGALRAHTHHAPESVGGRGLSVNALEATLKFGKPHEQGTAVALAGRDQRRDLLPLVVATLDDEYPLVRYFARHAIERITGAPLPIDLNAPGADVVKSAE